MAETMYDRIRDFALFKGTSDSQISAFVEKTRLKFEKYPAGETITESGDSCNDIIFIVEGTVEVCYYSVLGKELVSQQCGSGIMIGCENIYGMSHTFDCGIRSISDCGIFRLSKSQFNSLVGSDDIYFVNLMNLFSWDVQRMKYAALCLNASGILPLIKHYVSVLTRRKGGKITLNGDVRHLGKLTGLSGKDIRSGLKKGEENGLLKNLGDGRWEIVCREDMLQYII